MEQSQVKYGIAYDKTRQLVIIYPVWRGNRPNTHVIGEFTPENPRGNIEDYINELGQAVIDALARVGELDIDAFEVRITPLDGSKEFIARELKSPLRRVPIEDQIPVSLKTTISQARTKEAESGEGEPISTLATKELNKKDVETKKPGAMKKASSSKKRTK